jgi:3-hydroxyisobutyrate dehydrogenase
VFDAVGQKTLWVGAAGAGSRLKLVVNSWVLTVTEGTAETIALAEGLGLDPSLLFEAIDGGALDLPYLRVKGNAMIQRNFDPAFRLELAAKDARLVEDSARRAGLDLPVLAAVAQRMTEGAKKHGDKDMAATYLTATARG